MPAFLAGIILLAASTAAAQSTNIGRAAGVRGAVEATAPAPGSVMRVLSGGKELYFKDRVKTETEAQLQILLLDETTFTVGPHTEMILDEFVYDPKTGAGKVSVEITQGVFRFVSGKVAKKNHADMQVRVPVGIIGIRGTEAAGIVRPSGETTLVLKSGAVSLTNAYGVTFLEFPGDSITVSPGKAAPSPAQASQSVLAELHAALAPPAPTGSQAAGSAAAVQPSRAMAPGLPDLDSLLENANRDAASAANAASTWEEVRSIQSGTAQFSAGAGSYSCTGGVCGAGGSGAMTLILDIDFGNRTYGGGASGLALAGTLVDITPIATPLAAPVSYAGDAGKAVITLVNGVNTVNAAFDGTAITLENTSSVVAGRAVVNLSYTGGGGETAAGSGTFER